MSIHALPPSTVRSIGSSQVLTDPVSLVKELIENSLDAGATHITIETTPDLLTAIAVKDNGPGIPLEDRPSVCLRHHTSKIRTFTDIATVHTLGFRGEALSAACELSESLTFTTRVEGEPTAAQCEAAREGSLKSTRSVSAPIGTTVKVTGFLGRVPVRRENAKRNGAKNMVKLRALVATYYLSRPRTRFALRVTTPGKGKASQDLVYPPSKTVVEAARKVLGKDVAGAAEWVSNVGERTPGEFAIETYLLKADAAAKGVKGQYVYVDGRPVGCLRGTLKQVLGVYKTALKKAWGVDRLQEPFIWLNIICPEESYDANVEPAKDDVMFFEDTKVVGAVEEVLRGVYGELGEKEGQGCQKGKETEAPQGDFDVLLARRTPPTQRDTRKQNPTEEIDSGLESPEVPREAEMYRLTVRNSQNSKDPVAQESREPATEAQESDPTSHHCSDAANITIGNEIHRSEQIALESDAIAHGYAVLNQTESQIQPYGNQFRQTNPEKLSSGSKKKLTQRQATMASATPANNRTNGPIAVNSPENFREERRLLDEDEYGLLPLDEETIGMAPAIAEEAEREQVRKDKTLNNPWTAAKEAASYNSSSPARPREASPFNVPFKLQRPQGAARSSLSPTSARTPRSHTRRRENEYPPSPGLSPPRGPEHSAKRPRLAEPVDSGPIDAFLVRRPRSATRQRGTAASTHTPNADDDSVDEFGIASSQRIERRWMLQRCHMAPESLEDETRFLQDEARRRNRPQPPRSAKGHFLTAAQLLHEQTAENDGSGINACPEQLPASTKPKPQQQRARRIPNASQSQQTLDQGPAIRVRKNPNKNRYHSATAALSQQLHLTGPTPTRFEMRSEPPSPPPPAARAHSAKRLRTRTLLALEAVPEPQYQTMDLIRRFPFPKGTETLEKLTRQLRKGDQLYRYGEARTGFCFENVKLEELAGVIEAWAASRGADVEGLTGLRGEESEEGWGLVEAVY